jgi:HEAT repeat protein
VTAAPPDNPSGFKPNPRFKAIYQAKASGDVVQLIEALSDPDYRRTAATYLGELGSRDAIPHLVRLMRANDPAARGTAARVLGQLSAVEALSDLVSLVEHDRDDLPRSYAIRALGLIGRPEARQPLERILGDRESDVRLRRLAVDSLAVVGDANSVMIIEQAASWESMLRRARYRKARRAILRRIDLKGGRAN